MRACLIGGNAILRWQIAARAAKLAGISRIPIGASSNIGISSTASVSSRRVLSQFAFAVLLLLSQQLGIVHTISHLSPAHLSPAVPDRVASKKQLPAELQCDQCLAFAAIDALHHAKPPAWTFPPMAGLRAEVAPPALNLPSESRSFNPRAPPASSRPLI